MSDRDNKPLDNRNVLNAVTSVKAGQEQMQRDVDKLRAAAAATLLCFAYTAALAVLIIYYVRKARLP
ncbi:MAG TPA: hypothetical protein VHU24_03130 [Solirubrobacterales bacterium]|jgi:t-SNARE complex subunit (syntaxin)|nr:hypothetical protein [Solirubrobacterales bacterium]